MTCVYSLTNHNIWSNATTQHRTDNKCNRLDEFYNLVARGYHQDQSITAMTSGQWLTVERACKRDRPCPNGNEDSMAFLYTHVSTHTREDVDTSTQVKQQLWMGLWRG
eukprot:scaffold26102_cov75-Cyclotella_meneghiniana.AAC.3